MLSEYADLFRLISAIWAVVGLFVSGGILWWLYKYFPLRKEAITPEQLRLALDEHNRKLCEKIENTDFGTREAINVSISRVQTAFEMQHNTLRETLLELKKDMIEAHRKAMSAQQEATQANHRVELVQKDVTNLEKMMMERLDHLTTLMKDRAK